ncbi:MAG: hypothetical protein GX837_09395, partial [Methanomicrobiales archaeon]|nr:hypothetical protein [Methanomicrobiales archaeon]
MNLALHRSSRQRLHNPPPGSDGGTTGSLFTSRNHTPIMPDDREIIRAAIRKARELGTDVAGAVAAKELINCPSTVAEKRPGSEEDRGT